MFCKDTNIVGGSSEEPNCFPSVIDCVLKCWLNYIHLVQLGHTMICHLVLNYNKNIASSNTSRLLILSFCLPLEDQINEHGVTGLFL